MSGHYIGDDAFGLNVVNADTDSILLNYNNQFGFRYRAVHTDMSQEEQLEQSNTVTYNALFLHLEGEMRITWGEFKDVLISPGVLYFLPRGADVSACIVGNDISYIVVRLEHNLDNNRFANLHKIRECKSHFKYVFAPLDMKPQLVDYTKSMKGYLISGVDSNKLYDVKLSELHIILSWYYTLDECAMLFYPVIGMNSEFKTFVLDNYSITTSIEDLVEKANMSRSTFDRKFKEFFGITPLKWIEQQVRRVILTKATEPNITVKDIMYEVGIYNQSQFTSLCKRLCGVAPSLLIKQNN